MLFEYFISRLFNSFACVFCGFMAFLAFVVLIMCCAAEESVPWGMWAAALAVFLMGIYGAIGFAKQGTL